MIQTQQVSDLSFSDHWGIGKTICIPQIRKDSTTLP
jgi:hypothetical protein